MDLEQLRAEIASGDPSRSMPALARLREATAEQAEPLLLLGLQQNPFLRTLFLHLWQTSQRTTSASSSQRPTGR